MAVALADGTVLKNKYQIRHTLCRGGFGIVYEGCDGDELVMIKEYFPMRSCIRREDGIHIGVRNERSRTAFAVGLKQFRNESNRMLSLADCEGVADIFDFFEANGTAYIVMEYLDGEDLAHVVEREGVLPEERVIALLTKLLSILCEVHRTGILHRDIAPDNVLLTDHGDVRLLDFGSASPLGALDPETEVMLRHGYAPPEQYSRSSIQDGRTDLYSVGALGVFLLTADPPPEAKERAPGAEAVSAKKHGISEELARILNAALALDPAERPSSAEEMLKKLRKCSDHPERRIRILVKKKKKDKKGKKTKRTRLIAAAACGLVIVAALGLIRGLLFKQDAGQRTTVSEAAPAPPVSKADPHSALASVGDAAADNETEEDSFPMPDFKNASEGSAIHLLQAYGFSVQIRENPYLDTKRRVRSSTSGEPEIPGRTAVIKRIFDTGVKKGGFVMQSVPPGGVYEKESPLILYFSLGARADYIHKMPNLKGLTVKQAKTRLKKSGLKDVFVFEKKGKKKDPSAVISAQGIRAKTKVSSLKDRGRTLIVVLREHQKDDSHNKTGDGTEKNGSGGEARSGAGGYSGGTAGGYSYTPPAYSGSTPSRSRSAPSAPKPSPSPSKADTKTSDHTIVSGPSGNSEITFGIE